MKRILASAVVSFMPVMAFAQFQASGGAIGLIKWFSVLISYVIPVIIALAVAYFVYNVFKYAIAGNEDDKAKAKTEIIWGVIGLFAIISVWGLVNFLGSTFNLNNQMQQAPSIPTFSN